MYTLLTQSLSSAVQHDNAALHDAIITCRQPSHEVVFNSSTPPLGGHILLQPSSSLLTTDSFCTPPSHSRQVGTNHCCALMIYYVNVDEQA